jgi:hypothetical protein
LLAIFYLVQKERQAMSAICSTVMSSAPPPPVKFPATSSSPSAARPTRSLRKRQPAKLADDIDFDLETLLKEHEQSGVEYRAKRDAKKTKTVKDPEDDKYGDAFKGYDIPFESLPALCIEKIFSMVS